MLGEKVAEVNVYECASEDHNVNSGKLPVSLTDVNVSQSKFSAELLFLRNWTLELILILNAAFIALVTFG